MFERFWAVPNPANDPCLRGFGTLKHISGSVFERFQTLEHHQGGLFEWVWNGSTDVRYRVCPSHVYHTLTQDCWGWMGNCLGGGGGGGAASTRSPSPPTTVAPAAAPPPPPPPPDPPAVPTFDEERLRELSIVVDLRETLLGFIKHGRGLVDEVGASCSIESSEDSSSRTAKAAHALKGAAKTIGASRLAHYAEIIERKAKEGEACSPHVADLSAAYEDLATGVSKRTWY